MEKFPDPNNQLEKEKADFYDQVKIELGKILKEKGREILINRINKTLECFRTILGQDFDRLNASLEDLDISEDDIGLVNPILNRIKPILGIKFSNPSMYNRAMEMYSRSRTEENKGYVKLNELLYYGYGPEGTYIHLRVAPNK